MEPSSTNGLKPEQISSYRETGYLLLRQVFTNEEIQNWQVECERLLSFELIHPHNMRADFREVNGTPVIERLDPVIDISHVFKAVAEDRRILAPVSDLFEDQAQLLKDKLIFKLPGMTGYVVHQDAAWWQVFPIEDILTMVVAIDGADAENGALEIFPGYQNRLLSTVGEIRTMTEEEAKQIDLNKKVVAELKPGDVLLFHSFTPHSSGTNSSSRSRRQLYLTYAAAKHGDLYEAYRKHYQDRVRGYKEADTLFFL